MATQAATTVTASARPEPDAPRCTRTARLGGSPPPVSSRHHRARHVL